jgi:two-component system chemotaxis response regulator CheY
MDFQMTILVAEDFATMRQILCNCLRTIGFHNILEAENGLRAWEIIEREPIGLVVTDWHMPKMGGLELLQRIRGNPLTASLPVLMVTIENLKDNVIAAVQAGVNYYLAKPFTTDDLREKIELIFDRIKVDRPGDPGVGGKALVPRRRLPAP